jgi:hypothetical protein
LDKEIRNLKWRPETRNQETGNRNTTAGTNTPDTAEKKFVKQHVKAKRYPLAFRNRPLQHCKARTTTENVYTYEPLPFPAQHANILQNGYDEGYASHPNTTKNPLSHSVNNLDESPFIEKLNGVPVIVEHSKAYSEKSLYGKNLNRKHTSMNNPGTPCTEIDAHQAI